MCLNKTCGHTNLIAIFAAAINVKENITPDDLRLGFDEDEIVDALNVFFFAFIEICRSRSLF